MNDGVSGMIWGIGALGLFHCGRARSSHRRADRRFLLSVWIDQRRRTVRHQDASWWLEIFTLSAPAMSDTANAAQLMLKCSSARDGVE
jgi:hypothetical protein